jgi:hypothetical protein
MVRMNRQDLVHHRVSVDIYLPTTVFEGTPEEQSSYETCEVIFEELKEDIESMYEGEVRLNFGITGPKEVEDYPVNLQRERDTEDFGEDEEDDEEYY